MRREFFILANVNETQRSSATWNERTPEGKRRKQMAQVNLEIVLHSPDEVLSLRLDGAEALFTDLVQN